MPTVLIVDDNLDDRRILTAILEFYGYKVEAAHTGAAGIDVAKRLRPDLILMDIRLPDMSGFTTADFIRSEPDLAATPILCMTSLDISPADARQHGCAELFIKPFSPPELVAAVRRNLGAPENPGGLPGESPIS